MSATLFPIPREAFDVFRSAQNEADVQQAVIAELPSAPLEHLGIDYLHENLLAEFKYNESMNDPGGKHAEVLAQACYYCYLLRINEEHVPPYIALVDKKTATP